MRIVVGLLVLAGCDAAWMCEPGPWRMEVWSERPRVEAVLRDGCGFPDRQVDYRVSAHGRVLIEGNLEHFERRHAVAHRPDGSVEIAIWDRACVVTAADASCRELDYRRWE